MQKIAKIMTNMICSVFVIIGVLVAGYLDKIKTNKQALDMIDNVQLCRNKPDYCAVNILMLKLGSSTSAIEQRQYSDEAIAKKWVNDIKSAEQCVNRFANGFHLPQSVFDATVSITSNVGCTKMKGSTMYRYLNNGNYKAACHELPRWHKAGGKVLNGLVIRREKERELCLSGL